MICPGPVVSNVQKNAMTSTGDKANIVGKNGKRLQTDRCAHLIAISIANKLSQAWISQNPVLLLHYAYQYAPTICRFILPKLLKRDFYSKYRDQQ